MVVDKMFERHFVAYGVRIGLRVDCRPLLDVHLPFGWREVEQVAALPIGTVLVTSCRAGARWLPRRLSAVLRRVATPARFAMAQRRAI